MRSSQLLQARRHTPLDEAVDRIYKGVFDKENTNELNIAVRSTK